MGASAVGIATISWAAPIFASIVTLIGVVITLYIQNKSFKNQLQSNHSAKMAEMRQAWINNLRDAMSTFQSYAVTPNLDQTKTREFYEAGTKIELFMNPEDPDFAELQSKMYAYLDARDIVEKFQANPLFIEVCQKILRREWLVLKSELAQAHKIGNA